MSQVNKDPSSKPGYICTICGLRGTVHRDAIVCIDTLVSKLRTAEESLAELKGRVVSWPAEDLMVVLSELWKTDAFNSFNNLISTVYNQADSISDQDLHDAAVRILDGREKPNLYDIARQVTDEVLGEGTYEEINKSNPNPGVQQAILLQKIKEWYDANYEQEMQGISERAEGEEG